MARHIESRWLDGPAGKLEALLEEPDDQAPNEACVVCHPHPLFGGTMHNKVVHRIARGLRRRGTVVLRFNFRGVSRSEGSHDQGVGEVDDARAGLDWLRARYPGLPCALAGFSFGSRVVLKLGCASKDIARYLEHVPPGLVGDVLRQHRLAGAGEAEEPKNLRQRLFQPARDGEQGGVLLRGEVHARRSARRERARAFSAAHVRLCLTRCHAPSHKRSFKRCLTEILMAMVKVVFQRRASSWAIATTSGLAM